MGSVFQLEKLDLCVMEPLGDTFHPGMYLKIESPNMLHLLNTDERILGTYWLCGLRQFLEVFDP